MDHLAHEFKNPPLEFRSAPFWSWNDRLRPEELGRQVRDLQAHGMGGFFMHSRDGLETVYMGPEWLDSIRETVRVAKEMGIGAWLYDEDQSPLLAVERGKIVRLVGAVVHERNASPIILSCLFLLLKRFQIADPAIPSGN